MTRLRDIAKSVFDGIRLFSRALTSSTPLIGSFGRFAGTNPEENLEPIGLSEVKAQIVSLQSEATIAAFLAAVQAQIIAFSFDNNGSPLQKATNAFGFMGVLLDVVGTFLALLSSTLIQTNQIRTESFLDNVNKSTFTNLQPIMASLHDFVGKASPFGKTLMWEVVEILKNKFHEESEGRNSTFDMLKHRIKPSSDYLDLQQLDRICRLIDRFSIIGNAAGTAILSGFLCLLISVLFLAISSQPSAVYIPAAVACSCVVVLPALNRLMASQNARLPNPFEI